MRGKKSKQLRKTLRKKMSAVLLLIRDEYGDQTMQMSTQTLWRAFKRMYKRGMVPQNLIIK